MHTVFVLVGLGLLGACTFLGHVLGGTSGTATAALVFLPLWFLGAGINLYLGVKRAGYSVAEEAPIFLLVFAVPAAIAMLAFWKLRSP
jgi:hypothetical protein